VGVNVGGIGVGDPGTVAVEAARVMGTSAWPAGIVAVGISLVVQPTNIKARPSQITSLHLISGFAVELFMSFSYHSHWGNTGQINPGSATIKFCSQTIPPDGEPYQLGNWVIGRTLAGRWVGVLRGGWVVDWGVIGREIRI
jgi:hypothetical protein